MVAAVVGAPLFAVLMAAAMLGFVASDIDLTIVAIEVYRIVDTPLLMVLPLFTYSGYLLAEARTSERLVNLVQSLFGWLPSGLAMVGFVAGINVESVMLKRVGFNLRRRNHLPRRPRRWMRHCCRPGCCCRRAHRGISRGRSSGS